MPDVSIVPEETLASNATDAVVVDDPISQAEDSASGIASAEVTPPSEQPVAEVAPAETQTQSQLREMAKRMGYEPGNYESDDAMLNDLFRAREAYKASQQEIQQYRQVQPYLSEFQKYMAEQQRARQQEAAKDPWGRPEYNPEWDRELEIGEDGNIRLRKGSLADPSIVNKYQQAMQHRQTFFQKLWSNPEEALQPLLNNVAQQAMDAVQQQLSQREQQYTVQQIVQGNSDWMKTPDGRLTQDGYRYRDIVAELSNHGIMDVNLTHRLAMNQLQLERLQKGQQPVAQPVQPAAKPVQNGSTHRPPRRAAVSTPVTTQGASLDEMLREAMNGQELEFSDSSYSPR